MMPPKDRKFQLPETASRAASVSLPPFIAIQIDQQVRVYDLSGPLETVEGSEGIPDRTEFIRVGRGLNQ